MAYRRVLEWVTAGLAVIGGTAGLIAPACDRPPNRTARDSATPVRGRDEILTTFYPTEFFASRIASGKVPVRCPVPADVDPSFWQPLPEHLTMFQQAGLVVLNGAGYEHWTANAPLTLSRTLDSSRVFAKEFLTFPGITHSHGSAGAHSHVGVDGHTWMDPILATAQAEQIMLRMVERWPGHERAFRDGFQRLAADLAELAALWRSVAEAARNQRLAGNHPAWGYPARRFGFAVTTVDYPPEWDPSAQEWSAVESSLRAVPGSGPITLLFESAPTERSVARLSAIGIRSVVFSPCETLADDERASGQDFLTVMTSHIHALRAALESSTPSPPSP